MGALAAKVALRQGHVRLLPGVMALVPSESRRGLKLLLKHWVQHGSPACLDQILLKVSFQVREWL